MSMNIQSVEKIEILPSNQPNNNTYSFRGGNPIISDLKGGGASAIHLSSRVGVNACFQNVVLVSAASNQSLESIRNYGRLVSSLLSSTHSSQDMATEKSCTAVMSGLDSSSSNMCNNATRFYMRDCFRELVRFLSPQTASTVYR